MDRYVPEHAAQAIDLAAVPDFVLGSLRVQPSLRRVGAGAREESVEPRVMQALVALAEADGAVVSRDSLIDRCWAGRIVGEDAINRCIAKVRKLAEIAEPPAFMIETVSKVGYRLKALDSCSPAIAFPNSSPRPTGNLPTPPKHRLARLRTWLVCAIGLVMFAGVGAELWRSRPSSRWVVQSMRKLPRLGDEGDPRISPSGSMLAYVSYQPGGRGRIYVRDLQGGTPMAISAPDEEAGSPAWASDNVHLAYVVAGHGGEPCRIMVTRFPGGTPYPAGRCRQSVTTQIDWQPATPYLFLTDKVPVLEGQLTGFFPAIFRISTETGRSEQVTSPATSESDSNPRVSPDGEWVAYIHARGLQGKELRLRKLSSSEERALDCDADVTSIDWTPDSHTLIANVLGQMGSEVVAYPIDGAPGYRVYVTASSLGSLAAGRNGVLAVEVDEETDNLARASKTPHASADIIDPAAGLTDWPAFAPDGTLAFVSNRSGEMALWTRKAGARPTLLVRAGADDIERPVWSPDGSRIAFAEMYKGEISVRVVNGRGETIVSIPVRSIGYGMPNWTPDGEHVVVFDKEILQAVAVDLRNPAHRQPVEDKFRDGIQYRDGAIYSTSGLKSGIWQMNGVPRLITTNYPVERRARLAFVGNDVLLPDGRDGGDLRILAQPLKGGSARLAFYAPAAEPETPLAVDPLTGDVIYVSAVAADSHIELLTIARQ